MYKQPEIVTIANKKLIGQSINMSLANNKTSVLFSGFMPHKKQIENAINQDVYEVLIYDISYFKTFNPENRYTKWATVQVLNFEKTPTNMKPLTIKSGLYAMFTYKGLPQDFHKLMTYVFTQWLPTSLYTLDNRPHFNVLGKAYKNNDANSQETVYIPIKEK